MRLRYAILGLGMLVATPHATADQLWITRTVETFDAGTIHNADIMVAPDGRIAVGYSIAVDPTAGLLRLACLDNKLFRYQTGDCSSTYSSFAMDAFGSIYYTSKVNSAGEIVVGQDLGDWGGLVQHTRPAPLSNPDALPQPVIALDRHGIPSYSASAGDGTRYYAHFDVPAGQWLTTPLPQRSHPGMGQPASMTFDGDNEPCTVYAADSSGSGGVLAWQCGGVWQSRALETIGMMSLATAPDGRVAAAHGIRGLEFSFIDSLGLTPDSITSGNVVLLPHSLAFDPDGNPAIAYGTVGQTASLHLARREGDGTWIDEILPMAGETIRASLAFDASGNPYIVAVSPSAVSILGRNLPTLTAGDFDLDGSITIDDIPGCAQAHRHQADFLFLTQMGVWDFRTVADQDRNGEVDDADALAFLAGLPDRRAAYVALDVADGDYALGSGRGNFFQVSLVTGKQYAAGDSRADVNADLIVDMQDIDLVYAGIDGGDPRLDLNGDQLVTAADVHTILIDVLGTSIADLNLDNAVGTSDFAQLSKGYVAYMIGRNSGTPVETTFGTGDINCDGIIGTADFAVLSKGYIAYILSRSQPGSATTIPEPSALIPGLAAGLILARRRHQRPIIMGTRY